MESEDGEEEEEDDSDPEEGSSNVRQNPAYVGDLSSDDDSFDEDAASDSGESDNNSEDENPDDENPDEDDLIKALRKSKEKPDRNAPPDIKISSETSDISFHPESDIIAVASMDGSISLFNYAIEKNDLLKKLMLHKKNIRSMEFSDDGSCLYSASKDKSFKIIDTSTFKTTLSIPKAHGDSALFKIKPIDDHLYATGDEDGLIKLWDHRQKKDVMSEKQFEEFVTDICFDDEKKIMVASSGEGTIQSYNIRGKRPDTQSEVYEGQLNTLGLVKSDTKLVAGCDDGKLYLFGWGNFGLHEDQFPGHPDAINSLLAVTDSAVLTGCEDGTIRAVHLYPHRFFGVIGHHDSSFPIEKMDVSSTGELISSISHDQKVKFWNIKFLEERNYNKTKKPFKHSGKLKVKRKENKMRQAKEVEHQLPSSNRGNKRDFFKDLNN
eukprot:TRINITY_DN3732_c0_g1_i1.p1 TRINITY_DN3732_c0_g1~~TRINITY_DN3732_c0_g1_i1.p1  ORF type:complete len:475 (-),score=51.58 TRINITY_DN3732_c0_g1_i1:183-1490(-)